MAFSLSDTDKGQRDPAKTVRWQVKRGVSYIPAPLIYNGVLYMVRDGGIVTALHPDTGAVLKQGRVAAGEYRSSPVAADGKVFLCGIEGKVTVLKAGRSGRSCRRTI